MWRNTDRPSPGDVPDLSHVRIEGTTESQLLRDAVKRYGKLPGGIVVEGEASCDVPIMSLAIDPTYTSHLIINESLRYDTGLSPEEVALLWHAVLESKQAATDFGVLSQHEAVGIDNDNVVSLTMMQADNTLGGIIYGRDSQFVLYRDIVPGYRNPCSEEMNEWDLDTVVRLCLNHLYDLHPQLFLNVASTTFVATADGMLMATNTTVRAAIGVKHSGDVIVDDLPF